MTNQRISLVQGLIVAHITSRVAVLPDMNANGLQRPQEGYKEDRSRLLHFDDFYDIDQTRTNLHAYRIEVVGPEEWRSVLTVSGNHAAGAIPIHVARQDRRADWFRQKSDMVTDTLKSESVDLMQLDCAFLSIHLNGDAELQKLYWAIDSALVYAPGLTTVADMIIAKLYKRSREQGGDGSFNALHLRAEEDWFQHCKGWQPDDIWVASGQINCMSNTDPVRSTLMIPKVAL